ncbi:MAG: hypothetical protein JSS87_03755 [Acidobacteria bacterium]|nr:hypothetical protein [Acidobacteriota bacterium]
MEVIDSLSNSWRGDIAQSRSSMQVAKDAEKPANTGGLSVGELLRLT